MLEFTFLKELILIKQVHQKSLIFVTFAILLIKELRLNHMYAMAVMIYFDGVYEL